MSETCQFCGAGCGSTELQYSCGTIHDSSGLAGRGEACLRNVIEQLEARLARYDAMFPAVMPDDPGPITPEVCERLGLVNDPEWSTQWSCPGTDVSVWCFSDGGVQVNDVDGEDITTKTAGQLALLVAARKAVRNDAG